jgi:signal transduction histidine kinase
MKNQVEQYGGRFWVESEPGKPSEFHFALPEEAKEMHKEEKKRFVNEKH